MAPATAPYYWEAGSTWVSNNTLGAWWPSYYEAISQPVLSPRALARIHLARVIRFTIVEPAVLRDRCARSTRCSRRVVVARGNVGWIRQGGRRPLRGRR